MLYCRTAKKFCETYRRYLLKNQGVHAVFNVGTQRETINQLKRKRTPINYEKRTRNK